MLTTMEVPLQSELTECLVNARHWLLCLHADLTGDMCWGLGETQSCWRNMPITNSICYGVCSVQFSLSVMTNSLQPHGLQHARSRFPSPTPGDSSKSCASSWWCHPTISSSVILLSSGLQSFPVIGSFLMSKFFTSVGQSVGASTSASSSNKYSWLISFNIDWLYFLVVQCIPKSPVQHHSSKASILHHSPCFKFQLSHPYTTTGKS